MKRLFALLLLSPFLLALAREAPGTVDDALQRAQTEHRPVLIDFQAQWCYSCYYMASHVLTGPEWQAVEKRSLVIEVDADAPDGARWMKKLGVIALPTYVVLNPDGSELGRILAEQPRAKFYPAIERILGGGDSLDALKKKAAQGSTAAIAEVLSSYYARGQGDAALDWYATLPSTQRKSADSYDGVTQWLARLQMEKAQKAKDDAGCVAQAQRALAGNVGCDRYYVLETLLDCSEKTPAVQRKSLLEAQRPALDHLFDGAGLRRHTGLRRSAHRCPGRRRSRQGHWRQRWRNRGAGTRDRSDKAAPWQRSRQGPQRRRQPARVSDAAPDATPKSMR